MDLFPIPRFLYPFCFWYEAYIFEPSKDLIILLYFLALILFKLIGFPQVDPYRLFVTIVSCLCLALNGKLESLKNRESIKTLSAVFMTLKPFFLIVLDILLTSNLCEKLVKFAIALYVLHCITKQRDNVPGADTHSDEGSDTNSNMATEVEPLHPRVFREMREKIGAVPIEGVPIGNRSAGPAFSVGDGFITSTPIARKFSREKPLEILNEKKRVPYDVYVTSENSIRFSYNLRKWINEKIIQVLLRHCESVEALFAANGHNDIRIGEVGIDCLKVLYNDFVPYHIPVMSLLIRCLDICHDQNYLMSRLREMAIGEVMVMYRSKATGIPEHYPTDASLVFHLLCVYLDAQLRFSNPMERPFFDRYVILTKDMPLGTNTNCYLKNNNGCSIHITDRLHPEFNLVTSFWKVGCLNQNDLFNTLVLFLIYIKKYNEGYLDDIHLDFVADDILKCIDLPI